MTCYNKITSNAAAGKKMLAVLVDPDKTDSKQCALLCEKALEAGIDFFFVGGSLITKTNFDECILILKETGIPVILFPGSIMQVTDKADALLFLSLISGRNPDMLIGRHVLAAPTVKKSGLEVIPTGYLLIDSGAPTSVSYMSGTVPIPHDKNDIAACTAMAGEMLGMKLLYLDAGSGARFPIHTSMVNSVKRSVNIPIIAGGGIRTPEKAAELCAAGADMIVVGNALEKNPDLLVGMMTAIRQHQTI